MWKSFHHVPMSMNIVAMRIDADPRNTSVEAIYPVQSGSNRFGLNWIRIRFDPHCSVEGPLKVFIHEHLKVKC